MKSAALIGLAAVACEAEPDAPQLTGSVYVDSDPVGATIWVDDMAVGGPTPDTVHDVAVGSRVMGVTLDTIGLRYSYFDQVAVDDDTINSVRWPLFARCAVSSCLTPAAKTYRAAGLAFNVAPNGTLFFSTEGDGIVYPQDSGNGYAAAGVAMLAGFLRGLEPAVGASIYDYWYYAGRPATRVEQVGGTFELRQENWILPPFQNQPIATTARGVSIDHTITADDAEPGVLFVRLVFRNLTDDSLYLAVDAPLNTAPDQTYETAYAALALDIDVGTAGDDYISYVPDQDMAFVYDSDFLEEGYETLADRPALVGVRLLEAPAGTSAVLSGWPQQWDWTTGSAQEQVAWLFLSGTHEESIIPNHPDAAIGYVPGAPTDVRLVVSAGPFDLAAGDSAIVRFAVVLAEPVQGSYTSGTTVDPGDPFDANRPLLDIAADLIQRAADAGQ